jgi:indole-3-glycerol phosphate synthase
VDLKTTFDLAPLIPEGHVVVSESGIKNGYDIRLLREKGIHAVLVGTSMMTSDDPLQETRKLVHAGRLEDGQD